MYWFFCSTFTGYQSTQGLTTGFQPCASTLSPALLLSFYPSTQLPDTSVYPRIHALSVFLSSKLSHFVNEHSPLPAQLNGTHCLMDLTHLLLLLKQLSKPISSDLLYLLDVVHSQQIALYIVAVCVRACTDPIIMVCVPGVEYGFLCVYNVMWELFEGIYLNIVVIVMYFVASVMLSLLINDFICA